LESGAVGLARSHAQGYADLVATVFILSWFSLSGEPMGPPQRITSLPIRVGRNGLNDLVINHGGVSSFHARIDDIAGRLCITDLSSKNGTHLKSDQVIPEMLAPNEPRDLQPSGFEFFLGVHVRVRITFAETQEPLEQRGPMSFTGRVVGNAGALHDGNSQPPPMAAAPAMAPGWSPPQPFEPAAAFPGSPPLAPPGIPSADEHRAATGYLQGFTAEAMALQGLRELAASLVPGKPLETTGDIARFITKLHDTVDAFCRSFVPLREGHAQFMTSFDLQRSMRRIQQRSQAYAAVENSRTPEALAAALLDPKDRALDGSQALEGILADLMSHQLALLEGIMRGVHALLEELSPENVEAQAGGRLSLGRHKALWSKYCELFENVSEERQAFAVIFGEEFAAAYRQYRSGGAT
jgi:type VI secretion system protein ImpI